MRDENIAIKERLDAYMKRKWSFTSKTCTLNWCSIDALSQYRSGKYKGDIKAVESKIEEFLKTVEEQKEQEEKIQPSTKL